MAKDRKKPLNAAGKKGGPAGWDRASRGPSGASGDKGDDAGAEGVDLRRRWEGRVGPLTGEAGTQGVRADRYVADELCLLTRSQIKARGALFFVNGKPAKVSTLLKGGEALVIEWTEEASSDLVPEDLPIEVLYEDERVIVVNKGQGMVTHPGHGNRRGTLANAILWRLGSAESSSRATSPVRAASLARAGIVHRLDKDTSGVIIAAKDTEAQAFLAAQFKERSTKKEYLAIARGQPPGSEGRIENRLGRDRRDRKRFAVVGKVDEVGAGGRIAVTDWKVLATYGPFVLFSLRPRTGRTHQLRVHLASLGMPILGDPIYGKPDRDFPKASLMLHAYRLRIWLPGKAEPSLFKAPMPERFRRLIAVLEKRYQGKPRF